MRGDTLRRQIDDANAWAAERGIVIDETLTDLGVSAFRGKNRLVGALGKFLGLVEAGRIERGSYLIMESLDRLSREHVLEVLPRFLDLINSGITIVTLTDRQEYSSERLTVDSMPLIMSLVVMTRAHEESSTKAGRVAKAWAKKREAAAEGRGLMTARVPGWLKVVSVGGQRRIIENEDRFEIVRRVFRESAAGLGRRRIVEGLQRDGVPVFGSGKRGWQSSYVKKLLESRAVIGEYQPTVLKDGRRVPTGLPIQGYYPAIITEAEFARANLAKGRRRIASGRPAHSTSSMLRGLVFCAACGMRMTRLNKGAGPKGGAYLVCSDADRKVGCGNSRRWRLDDVERRVIMATGSSDLRRFLEEDDKPDQVAPTRGDIEVEIEALRVRRAIMLDLAEKGDDDAAARSRAHTERIKALTTALKAAIEAEGAVAAEPTFAARQAQLRDLIALLDTATGAELDSLRLRIAGELRAVYSRITFSAHQIAVVRRSVRALAGGQPPRWPASPIVIFDDHPDHVAEREAEEHLDGLDPDVMDANDAANARLNGMLRRMQSGDQASAQPEGLPANKPSRATRTSRSQPRKVSSN